MFKKNCLAAFVVLAFVALLPESVFAACGEILVSKGDVKVESGKDKTVKAAPQGTKVCQGDTVVAGAQSRAKVKMEDGNELNISPDSKILLESYEYKAADNKKKVLLNVLYGKVRAATREENMYNDKAADGQANTFQVKTKSAVAGVRGTDFLTSFDAKSSKTEIVTFKGNVEVGTPGPGGAILNAVAVGAGQKTEALPGAPPAPPKAVPATEMNRMNTETKGGGADSAGGKNNEPVPAQPNRDGDKDKQDRQPNSDSAADKKGPADKAPDKAPDKVPEKGPDRSGGSSASPSANGGTSSGGSAGGAAGGAAGRTGFATPNGAGALPIGDKSMISKEDMGTAPIRGPAAIPMPNTMMPPPPPPMPMLPPVPPLVNQTVESGPGKVNITITIPQ